MMEAHGIQYALLICIVVNKVLVRSLENKKKRREKKEKNKLLY
jgi:hypothetical protein